MEVLNRKKNTFSEFANVAFFIAAVISMVLIIAYLIFRHNEFVSTMEMKTISTSKARAGVVSAAQGVAYVTHKNSINSNKIIAGEILYAGDRVQTSRDGKTIIKLESGVEISLDSNSLIQMPETTAEGGGALEIESGNLSVKGAGPNADLPSLHTPQAVIRLRSRNLVSFGSSAGLYGISKKHLPAGAGEPYRYFETIYSDFIEKKGTATKKLERLIHEMRNKCGTGEETVCIASLDAAWVELINNISRKKSDAPVNMSINVAKGGAEEIKVNSGAVRVETGNRVLAIAKGDRISLEKGAVPTAPSVSKNAMTGMATGAITDDEKEKKKEPEPVKKPKAQKKNEIYMEIDSMQWQ